MLKQADIYIKESSEYKQINISTDKPDIDGNIIDLWQDLVNIIADISDISSANITIIKEDSLNILVASDNLENPFNETVCFDLKTGSFFEETFTSDESIYIKDASTSDLWNSSIEVELDMVSYYGVPIKWPDGQYFGTFSVLSSKEIKLNETLKLILSSYKSTIETHLELLVAKTELYNLSYIDELTGAYNRRKIKEYQLHEFDIARRSNNTFSIILVDLDRFSLINESYGYEHGDTVLKFFSDLILSRLRSTDHLGRWNSDVFIVVCPNTDTEGAKILKYDIINAVENHCVRSIPELSCSVGIAEYALTDEDNFEMIKRADIDLYRDKSSK